MRKKLRVQCARHYRRRMQAGNRKISIEMLQLLRDKEAGEQTRGELRFAREQDQRSELIGST